MYFPGLRIYEFRERKHVSTQELLKSAYAQNQSYEGHFRSVFFKHLLGGGIRACGGFLGFRVDFKPLEQDVAHLTRRSGIECPAGHFKGLLFKLFHSVGETSRHLAEYLRIDSHAGPLHFREHPGKGQLYVVEQFQHGKPLDFRAEHGAQPACHVGRLAIARHGVLQTKRLHRIRTAAFRSIQQLPAEIFGSHGSHVVFHLRVDYVVRNRGIEILGSEIYSLVFEHEVLTLHVVAHDFCIFVFKDLAQ